MPIGDKPSILGETGFPPDFQVDFLPGQMTPRNDSLHPWQDLKSEYILALFRRTGRIQIIHLYRSSFKQNCPYALH